jgi:hypothetical protein
LALTKFSFKLLAPHLKGARIVCFGYPDLLVTPAEVREVLGIEVVKTTSFGSAHKIRHGLADTVEVFEKAGVRSVEFFDLVPSRGVEKFLDLNHPVEWTDEYDLAIDAGTIEHCANVGGALMNVAKSIDLDGRVFHSPPLSMHNHGFYNICPTLLHDFYSQNGWTIEHLSGFLKSGFAPIAVEPTKRFQPPIEAALYFLAARNRASQPYSWPRQTKYK